MAEQPKSAADVIEIVKEHDVRFVRLWFTDVLGQLKSFSINAAELEDAFDGGMGFDGSSITGFNPIEESDMIAMPDPSTFALIPWRPEEENAVARMFCDIRVPGGGPYEGDPRWILQRALKRAEEMGFDAYNIGPELEFFYFRSAKPEGGVPEVLDEGGYFDLTTLDAGSDVRRDTVLALEKMGIHVEYTHHEVGPSQHEVDMRYKNALEMADDCMTYRIVVKEYAMKYGWHATFMPKPLFGENGSGMHVHQSLTKDGKNAFYDADDPYFLSPTAKAFIAGQLKHAREISPLFAQWVNSYKRLVPGLRGAGLPRLVAPQPLGADPGAALPPRQGGRDPGRAALPRPRLQPLPLLRRHAAGGPGRDREGLRAARADGAEPLPPLARRSSPTRGSSSCRRRWARRSRSPPTRSWSCARWASTPSAASSRSSGRNGTTTASRSPRTRSKTSCRSSEAGGQRWRRFTSCASSATRTASGATRSASSSTAARCRRSGRQEVAAELGFSETVFVDDARAARCRIFTPGARAGLRRPPDRRHGLAAGARRARAVEVLRPPAGEVAVRRERRAN